MARTIGRGNQYRSSCSHLLLFFELTLNESQGFATFFLGEAYEANNDCCHQQGKQESSRVSPESRPNNGLVSEQIANHNDSYHERTQIGMLYKVPDFEVELEMK